MKDKKFKNILKEFIEIEEKKLRIGSGDDEFYVNQINEYVNKQKGLWLDFTKFMMKKEEELKKGEDEKEEK